jgi:hypothetical protein
VRLTVQDRGGGISPDDQSDSIRISRRRRRVPGLVWPLRTR